MAANQDSVVITDHSYFKVPDPSADDGEHEEPPKRKKGRPRKYKAESPKTQTKLTSFTSNKTTAKSDSPSASQNTSIADTPNSKTPTKKYQRKYQRRNNCGKCVNCTRQDCGKCRNCLDKPKFGGRNTKKQRCIQRICIHKASVSCITLYTAYWLNHHCIHICMYVCVIVVDIIYTAYLCMLHFEASVYSCQSTLGVYMVNFTRLGPTTGLGDVWNSTIFEASLIVLLCVTLWSVS